MTTAGSDPVDSAADDDYPEARVSVHTGQLNGGKGDTDSGGSGSSTEPNSSVFADIYASVQKIWSEPTIYRALLLGCFLQMAQQIAGINTVMYYTATILKLAGQWFCSMFNWSSNTNPCLVVFMLSLLFE